MKRFVLYIELSLDKEMPQIDWNNIIASFGTNVMVLKMRGTQIEVETSNEVVQEILARHMKLKILKPER